MKELQNEIEKIKERNKKVEADKAWEVSKTRKITIAVVTYIFMVWFMNLLSVEKPLISALVPTAGYLLSTLSIGLMKTWWLKSKFK